ncbi:T9SS type A sorting domain-containing protein [Flavobacterium wongokense]|uniref:T9SS type A sorting domain-containing protein n=1 Tax=Flavobacterium wongokense TaxID=2910674 RepID=UPI001F34E9DA|nr:T9SS type A sorting domain-containing protein [Flavobacterium sp. WG47]MCF6132171.1 T9SS type A sorting domain-containing protein [Flavobacterium sp. WG47]
MKAKLLLSITFLFLFAANSFAQPYVPMLNNSTWIVKSANFGGEQSFVMGPATNVTIGAYTYKKYTDQTVYSTDNYVREDVAARKVYRNVNGVDQLLYDFSLQVGNHIVLANGKDYTVQSITDVNVNGGTRKKFYLINWIGSFAGQSETWIEGVGSNRHPLKPQFDMFLSDPYIYLGCSAQNGVGIYNHGLANGQPTPTDCSALLSVEEINQMRHQISYSPNPFNTELRISSKVNFENATVKMYNSIGQLIREIADVNGDTAIIKRENLNNGVYFVQVVQEGKLLSTNKIIVAD